MLSLVIISLSSTVIVLLFIPAIFNSLSRDGSIITRVREKELEQGEQNMEPRVYSFPRT